MKELNMLVWTTQLGISVAAPLAGFTLAGLWLRDRFGLGIWGVPEKFPEDDGADGRPEHQKAVSAPHFLQRT